MVGFLACHAVSLSPSRTVALLFGSSSSPVAVFQLLMRVRHACTAAGHAVWPSPKMCSIVSGMFLLLHCGCVHVASAAFTLCGPTEKPLIMIRWVTDFQCDGMYGALICLVHVPIFCSCSAGLSAAMSS